MTVLIPVELRGVEEQTFRRIRDRIEMAATDATISMMVDWGDEHRRNETALDQTRGLLAYIYGGPRPGGTSYPSGPEGLTHDGRVAWVRDNCGMDGIEF